MGKIESDCNKTTTKVSMILNLNFNRETFEICRRTFQRKAAKVSGRYTLLTQDTHIATAYVELPAARNVILTGGPRLEVSTFKENLYAFKFIFPKLGFRLQIFFAGAFTFRLITYSEIRNRPIVFLSPVRLTRVVGGVLFLFLFFGPYI